MRLEQAEAEFRTARAKILANFTMLWDVASARVFEERKNQFEVETGGELDELTVNRAVAASREVTAFHVLKPRDAESCRKLVESLPADFTPPFYDPSKPAAYSDLKKPL